jgi:hypothetical protein
MSVNIDFYRYIIDMKYILSLTGEAPKLYCKKLLKNLKNLNYLNNYQN